MLIKSEEAFFVTISYNYIVGSDSLLEMSIQTHISIQSTSSGDDHDHVRRVQRIFSFSFSNKTN